MKPVIKDLLIERMKILIKNAVSYARSNPELAERQAALAKRLVLNIVLECLMS